MGLNTDKNNTYRVDFTPGTNCNLDGDNNNFVYVSQNNSFDKDVWNYNTKQTSLYIDNLKKIITNLTDDSDNKPTISSSTISNSTISNSNINVSKDKILSLGTLDSDTNICTKLNPYAAGPAFNTKIETSDSFMSDSNWSNNNQTGIAIYHNGLTYCIAEYLQELHFRYNWTNGNQYYLASLGYGGYNAGEGWAGSITVMDEKNNITGKFRTGDLLVDRDLRVNGTLYANTWISLGSAAVQFDSDKKLKSNITSLSTNESLKLITSLKPKSYNFKDDKDKKIRYGFIAQDVEKILQDNNLKNTGLINYQLIKTNEDVTINKDNYKDEEMKLSLSYIDFIAPTVQVVQYQQKEIESLKKEINELKQIISNK